MIFLANSYLTGCVGFVVGALLIFIFLRWKEQTLRKARTFETQTVIDATRREADGILRESRLRAEESALKLRQETEQSFAERLKQITEAEARLTEREHLINRQLENVVAQEKTLRGQSEDLQKQNAAVEAQKQELAALARQRLDALAATARLSETDARAQLLKEIEQQAQSDAGAMSRKIIEEAKTYAEEKARWIISTAIQRYAGSHTFESTSSTLALPDNEIKGRIIGREGRNIRSFEAATGVTVLIDDTPNAVVLSGFDPVRREIAREAMQRLILDGRIHPTRIEEVVARVSEEMDESILRAGEEAVMKVGLSSLNGEIIKLLGRLRFRYSFSQNILDHSIEVAHLTGLMAAELNLDPAMAKRAGLLHDIGKAINHEVEGAHAIIGADFIKRYGESDDVVNGVASHHDEVPHTNVLGILVSAADAISASRPGARSETLTTYIKRLENLEKLGRSFTGVDRCFAVQAGRGLRGMVQPDQINDEDAFVLARNIARKIEEELHYPGQIRVTVIRETRCVEFAK